MLQTAVLTALAVLLAQGVAFGQIVELEARYWFIDLNVSAKAKSGSLPGSDIDLGDDLGLKSENAPEGRLTFFAGPNSRIRLAYTRLDFEGDKTLGRTITFEGETFTANSRVATDLDIQYGRLAASGNRSASPEFSSSAGFSRPRASSLTPRSKRAGSCRRPGNRPPCPSSCRRSGSRST